jgi:diguanylate cyclase (GGDEF)-like protein
MQLLQERTARPGRGFTMLFIDLDGFKAVNDTLGHGAGDTLLLQTALRLRAIVGNGVVGRLGGDEFVVLQAEGSAIAQALALADALITHVGRPYTIDGQSVQVTPSIGIAACPEHGQNPADLLRSADVAMYAAKEQGRNRAVAYHGDLDHGRQRRLQLQQLLRADAEREAFSFVVQLQVDMRRRPVGGELLMRWQTPAFGVVSPAEFIPLAEQIGVIDRMGRLALRTAARVAHELAAARLLGSVSVNLSPRQLLHDDVERALLDACMAAGAEPARIELELTESALVTDVAQVGALLTRLAGHGFRLALDDFGTGYSSLSHLRQLPFHKVKIDRSFVQDLNIESRSLVMLEGVVRLCDSLGLATVAEGVETREQFEMLRRLGIACFQGYWFARPQPLAEWMAGLSVQGQAPRVVAGGC